MEILGLCSALAGVTVKSISKRKERFKPSNQVIISLDAVALYPSLEADKTSRVCAEMITSSGLWIESIDWEEVGLYVKLTGGDQLFSHEIIPQRRYTAGAKPSITTYEVLGPLQRDKNKSKFLSPARLPSQEEKNALLATLLQTAMKTLMTHHTYRWKGEVRLQSRGQPIGDKLAQAAARLYMIWWDKCFLVLLESSGVVVRLFKRYVDDGNMKLIALEPGAQWDDSTKTIVHLNPSEDDRLPDRRTAEVVKCMADSVSSMLTWTADYPSANDSGKLPILDIETWCEETQNGTRTCYSFYSKPMANPIAIPASSAIPSSTKFSTYRQEVCRIMSNTSMHLPWSHKAALLTNFSWRLKVSGYPKGFRSKIISEGLTGYLNTLRRRVREGVPLNRPKDVIRRQSRKRKINSNNWFKEGQSTYNSVLYVPATPASELAKMLQQHESENNQGRCSRIKIVEKAGQSIKNILAPNDPWGVAKCKSLDCFVCSTNTGPLKVSCRSPGVVYTIICTLCEEEGRGMAVYYGQSGKNCYARGKKHLEDFKSGDNSHCMTIHAKVHHPNEQRMMSKFKMIPLRTYRKPLERQIKEALLINNSEVDILLNSGSEWGAGRVPRASVSRPS